MNRKGFTLIELLIVVVIIGILAAIAIPKFANTKEKAYIASMKSDLRNLVTAEEAYFADSLTYSFSSSNCAAVPGPTQVNFCPSTGNTLAGLSKNGAGDGWQATMTNINAPLRLCAIFIGTPPGPAPATKEGEPKCQ